MTHDVSPYGVHDLTGSVKEIVEDDFLNFVILGISEDEFLEMVPLDGTPWMLDPRSDSRAVKGGSWGGTKWTFSTQSTNVTLRYGYGSNGFRCAAD